MPRFERGIVASRSVRPMLVSVGDLATDVVAMLGVHELDPVSDTPAKVVVRRGGSAANVAAVSARLGRPSRFVGALGVDDLGRSAAASLADGGVDVTGPEFERGSTLIVLVDPSGGRRFVTDPGVGPEWGEADPAWLDGATRLHFTAYALCDERSRATCLALSDLARSGGIPRSVDPSSVSVLESFGLDRFRALIDVIAPDMVFPNADEWHVASGVWGAPVLQVVTDGGSPTRVIGLDGEQQQFPVAPVRVVDSTGAGDAFAAGFLRVWDERPEPAAAVAAGHDAAARVVGGVGADAWEDAPHDD